MRFTAELLIFIICIEGKQLIPDYPFGLQLGTSNNSVIEKCFDEEDVTQAFDKTWHNSLIVKLKRCLLVQHVQLLDSYNA